MRRRYFKWLDGSLCARFGLACALSLLSQSPLSAGMLDLELLDSPDVFSAFLSVSYDSAAEELHAVGFAFTLEDEFGTLTNINNGTFELFASVSNTGVATNGTLTIGGELLGLGSVNPLLTGDLTDFGAMDGGGDLFEFLFTVTGGDLANTENYGEPGAIVGVILTGAFDDSDSAGVFSGDFANGGMGFSDTARVPEPATIWLGLFGLCAIARRKRRRAL